MTALPDADVRLRALTTLDQTFLVEAAAGTGKTALLTGRIALLLCEGAPPASIAAITFTRLAANELSTRVRSLIFALLRGETPAALRAALPNGLSQEHRTALSAAAERLDELTTTTIHGFCQDIVRGYAVEADIDPGADVLDRDAQELAFGRVFDAWLQRRLSGPHRSDDPVAILARADPRSAVRTLRDLAVFRLAHRSARPPAADLSGRPDIELSDAVDGLRRRVQAAAPADAHDRLIQNLEHLDRHYAGRFAETPDFQSLWTMATPPTLACMRRKTFDLLPVRFRIAGSGEAGLAEQGGLSEAFAAVDVAYRRLLGKVSGAVVDRLCVELDGLLADYAAYKRSAAVLDFTDLLDTAAALLRTHESVRQAVGERFRHLLVDEFQDTDPVQCDIIFRIAAETPRPLWTEVRPRAGALFLVGDPKQAVYQFRGAQVLTYETAKAAVEAAWPGHVLRITANFRSRPGVLAYVNTTFADPLSAPRQPGYVALESTRAENPDRPGAYRLKVDVARGARREEKQDAEAEAVAACCARLIGAPWLDDGGTPRAVAPRDIALLAPTRNDLWRYEQALARLGLPFAAEAGDALFRRQETQDIVALVRVLADARDTAAFGALMRGPLVGLTDRALLDITEALPRPEGAPAVFSVATPLDQIANPAARAMVEELGALRRRGRFTSPVQLLGEAIERLGVRVCLALRDPTHTAAANANIDALLERAGRYGVRGLRRLAADLSEDWQSGARAGEGRAEADGDRIAIVTMHAAKGLEWPIVIPINAMVQIQSRRRLVHRPPDDSLHWMIGDVAAPELAAAVQDEAESLDCERARLWYVACTRARDHLILSDHNDLDARAWGRILDLGAAALPLLDLGARTAHRPVPDPVAPNLQDAESFAAEAVRVAAASPALTWLRPSDHDADRARSEDLVVDDLYDEVEDWMPTGGRLRGLLLHKLIEEVIAEGLAEDDAALTDRARVLAAQLLAPGEHDDSLEDLAEMVGAVQRTLALADIAELRSRLRVEFPVYGSIGPGGDPMAGRADAVAVGPDGAVEAVIDWKSDVAPTPGAMAGHADQLRLYLEATGAQRGAIVYMSLGRVRWIDAASP